ncbi:MAG: DUF3536 domain-containing protein [Candidatus Omnitrophica bacterium]|nr:DUF3536 domain-containing protein [Candidatus Omnitrophota bacterium]
MNKYICIHGHFYQPPRENPWLEEVERQDSAYPYHDWNERVTAECYAPNSTARILGEGGKITDIMSNYSNISFNFGPTLLSWMAKKEPEVYQALLSADKESQKNFSGHGSALAQGYNHMILPLATSRDKYTQIVWGIKDFEYRFKRKPQGMWLPETAVDIETLDMLASCGIKFTILAPRQAKRMRKIGDKRWKDISGSKIDPRHPYQCALPSGRAITLFFYDGPVSQGVAFEGLLSKGEDFAGRLLGVFLSSEEDQLVHIATDGETYGHHHRDGDMGLAYCIDYIRNNDFARITIYSEYLENHPSQFEVEIYENSSWSCIHGIERWRNNCGCNSGGHPQWNQEWRAPLRGALDWLRDNLAHIYEEQMTALVKDAWGARDAYIDVILDRSPENIDAFFKAHQVRPLNKAERIKTLKLLEMQRQAMLMYTSCGWFFDEVSGIETVQIILYAARAIQLAHDLIGAPLEETFITLLEKVPSNIARYGNAKYAYEYFVKPFILDFNRVGAHYAISSLFNEHQDVTTLYCYTVKNQEYILKESGKSRLVIGKADIFSKITQEETSVDFAVLHLGDHNFFGGVLPSRDHEDFLKMKEEISGSFEKGDIPGTLKMIEQFFPDVHYTLWHLFKDEQRKILYQIIASTISGIESSLKQISDQHYPILSVLKQLNMPLPTILASTLSATFNIDLMNCIDNDELDSAKLKGLIADIQEWDLTVDKVTLGFRVGQKIETLMKQFYKSPQEIYPMQIVRSLIDVLGPLGLTINLWKVQNLYFSVKKNFAKTMQEKADQNDKTAQGWLDAFNPLGEYLRIRTG